MDPQAVPNLHIDGYRAELIVDTDAKYNLVIRYVKDGQIIAPGDLSLAYFLSDEHGTGAATRAADLVDALCRFRNRGGDVDSLERLVREFVLATSGSRAVLPDVNLFEEVVFCLAEDVAEHTSTYRVRGGQKWLVVDGQFTDRLYDEPPTPAHGVEDEVDGSL